MRRFRFLSRHCLQALAGVTVVLITGGCSSDPRTGAAPVYFSQAPAAAADPAASRPTAPGPATLPTERAPAAVTAAEPSLPVTDGTPPQTDGWDPQVVPVVSLDVAAQRASVLAAGDYPERHSPYASPRPFDAAAYARNPQAYCDTIEPGRCFQMAAQDSQAPMTEQVSRPRVVVAQGATTTLVLRVPPRAPVTFTSFDLGTFANGLGSITVQADDAGYARAVWTASPGVVNDAQILAACPLTRFPGQFTLSIPAAVSAERSIEPAAAVRATP